MFTRRLNCFQYICTRINLKGLIAELRFTFDANCCLAGTIARVMVERTGLYHLCCNCTTHMSSRINKFLVFVFVFVVFAFI